MTFKTFSFALCVSASFLITASAADYPDTISNFAFGSCAKERQPQPIWNAVLDTEPQLFLFIGDNHYADTWEDAQGEMISAPVTKPERIAEAYSDLAAKPGFKKLRASTPVLATWDDHDYGANDQGKHYPLKRESQQLFMDFFGFANDHPIREQEGVYQSKIIGTSGQQVQFILLDTRYHRDDLMKNPAGQPDGKGAYIPTSDKTASMLGETQWAWLEEQLNKPADIRFIISSIQVVAWEHAWESWGTMPHERQRLYDLIGKTKASGVVFLSGDRHLTEVSVDSSKKTPYPMWDFTASGMTDDIKTVNEFNSYRKGSVYRGAHFGTVNIQWAENKPDTQIVLTALTKDGELIYRESVQLRELTSH